MKPFLQGRKLLCVEPLRLPPALIPASARPGTSARCVEPAPGGVAGASVEVVKEGNKVVRLAITCRCGEQFEIDCLYAAGS